MPNINVNVQRNTEGSDRSSYQSRDSQASYQSSSHTSALEETLPLRNKPASRPDSRNQIANHIRPASVRVEYDHEEDPIDEQPMQPVIIQGPAPDAPTARPKHRALPAHRDASDYQEVEFKEVEVKERHREPHRHKKHRRKGRDRDQVSISDDTEEMDHRPGPPMFQDQYGNYYQEPQRQYPAPHDYIPPQHHQSAPSQHPGIPQQNNALMQMSPYGQQPYAQPGYPMPQSPFYPQSLPQSPMGMGMGMPPQFFAPWPQMMGAMQPPPSASPPPAEPNEELLRLRAEDAARRAREIKMIEDAEQAKQNIEIEAARKKVEKAEKEELAKANAAAIAKGIENYKKAEEEKAKQEKAVKEVKEQVKKAADEEAAKKLKEKELEYKKELEKLTKEAEEAKLEAAALKGLPEDQQMVNIDIFAASMTKSKRFGFPFSMAKNWKIIHPLLVQAYTKEGPALGTAMEEGQYDIVGPDGINVLAPYWDKVVKPETDYKLTVRLPEPPPPLVQTIPHGKYGPSRSKSSKGKRRPSSGRPPAGVMWGEFSPDMHGAAPPPPPAPSAPPTGVEISDDIVFIEDDDPPAAKPKKSKKQPEKISVFDLFIPNFGSKSGSKRSKR